jgi:aspartyl-tRNA(Asn)/glutamyl-tRNA(Gln) amidotransferase subunit A
MVLMDRRRDDLHHASITQVAASLRAGAVTSVEVTEHLLDRIDRANPTLNAFITVTPDLALEQARRADRELSEGRDRGPLHGIPVSYKDLIATAGVRTTAGSRLYEDRVPDHDASVVRRLAEAGAVTLGKTGLHEIAWGSTSINAHFGAIANPWRLDHHPGGSSGGSAAAVAAGLSYASLGTDTGCSIRQPAQCCGVVGHKPTFGLVSKAGVGPLVWSLDHVGPITRSVRDAAILIDAIAGYDVDDPYSLDLPAPEAIVGLDEPIDGLVVGVPRAYFFECGDADVVRLVEEAIGVLATLGARVVDVDVDADDLDAALDAVNTLFADTVAVHGAAFRARPDLVSPRIRDDLERIASRPAAEYAAASHFRHAFRRRLAAATAGCDVLATPTSTVAADPIESQPRGHGRERWKNCAIFNLTGQPSISVPCGFTAKDLPAGLMLTGRREDDRTVLRLAHAYEQATPWHARRPPAFE